MASNWSLRNIVVQGLQGWLFTVIGGVALALLTGILGSVAPFTKEWMDYQRVGFAIGLGLTAFVIGVILVSLAQSYIPFFHTLGDQSGRRSDAARDDGPGLRKLEAMETTLGEIRDALLGSPSVGQPEQTSTTYFNPTWIIAEIGDSNFAGLWSDDPEIAFRFLLINTSPYKITITGVTGQIQISGTPCNRPLIADKLSMAVNNVGGRWNYQIRQPLTDRMAENLRPPSGILWLEDTMVAVWLGQLQLQGTVHLPDGDIPLKDWHGFGTVIVRGPIRTREEAASLSPFQPSLGVHGQVYDGYGRFTPEWKSATGT